MKKREEHIQYLLDAHMIKCLEDSMEQVINNSLNKECPSPEKVKKDLNEFIGDDFNGFMDMMIKKTAQSFRVPEYMLKGEIR